MIRFSRNTTIVLSLLLAAAPVVAASEYSVIEVSEGGTVSGLVRLAGEQPVSEVLAVNKDQSVCGESHQNEDFVIDPKSKGLMNVFVSLEGIAAGKDFAANSELTISQQGCVYAPHVQVYRPNSKLTIRNEDKLLHSIHGYSGDESLFNLIQPAYIKQWPGTKIETEGIVNLKCDVHEWMNAYLIPVVHPYFALTDSLGAFEINQVPPGSYALATWHEALGAARKPVVISANDTTVVGFDLSIPAQPE